MILVDVKINKMYILFAYKYTEIYIFNICPLIKIAEYRKKRYDD